MPERRAAAAHSPRRVLLLSKAYLSAIYQGQLECIAASGVDLRVLLPPCWRDERGVQRLERVHTQGYRLEILPLRWNGRFHWYSWRGLGKALRDFRPQVVHIDEEPYNLAAWQAFHHARRVGAKTLFASWQNLVRRYPPPFSWGERRLLRGVDYLLAGTEGCAAVWRAKGYRGPLAIAPQCGVDTRRFQPLDSSTGRPFTIGYVGRLVPAKGVDLLLRALSELSGDWRLRIVGGGPEREALLALAAVLGIAARVQFSPQQPSVAMPAVYHTLDALVLPSRRTRRWQEQFGRVLTEAMACAIPVVGATSGAIPDVVGAAGLLFPEGDARALTEQLRRLQQDAALRAELGQLGRRRVEKHFTQEVVAAKFLTVYRELLSGE